MDIDAAYREHAQAVYLYALSLCHDAHLAQDLTEDTFLRAMRTLRSWKGDCALLTWLCAITRNLFIDHCNRSPGRRELPLDADLPARAQEDGKLLNLYVSTKASWASHLRSTINPWAENSTLDIDLSLVSQMAIDKADGVIAMKLGEDAVVERKPCEDDCVVAAVYFCGGEFGDEEKTVLLWEAKPEQYPMLTIGALREMSGRMNH